MRNNVRNKAVCWALLVGWFSALSLAAENEIVGRVVLSPAALINGVEVPPDGGTVVPGDLLSTPKGGGAFVNSQSRARISLSEETAIRFENASGGVAAQILAGTVMVSATGKNITLIKTPKYRIEPAQEEKVVYLVGLLPDRRTVVAARHGKVSITETSSGHSYLLADGRYVTIADSSSGVPGQGGPPIKTETQAAVDVPIAAVGAESVVAGWQIGLLPAGSSLTVPGVVASPTVRTSHEAVSSSRPKPSPH
jgi:hypothetical protein